MLEFIWFDDERKHFLTLFSVVLLFFFVPKVESDIRFKKG